MANDRIKTSDYLIQENTDFISVMKVIDKGAKGIVFVVDSTTKLVGCITDGDVRRWIINNSTYNAIAKDFMERNPKSISEKEYRSINDKQGVLEKIGVRALPVIDESGCVIDIVFDERVEFSKTIKSNKKQCLDIPVVIMAGGKGTRLFPYTKILPKPLIPIGENPIVEIIMNRFIHNGCNRFFMIINHKKNMIKAYFNEIGNKYDLCFVEEEKPLGTGGGLKLLNGKVDSSFILTNCDILLDADFSEIYERHKSSGNIVTMVCSLKSFSIPYGVVDVDEKGEIITLREKPEMTYLTNTGCYIVEPKIFDYIPDDSLIGFPDVIKKCIEDGLKVGIFPVGERAWYDMGEFEPMERMRMYVEEI